MTAEEIIKNRQALFSKNYRTAKKVKSLASNLDFEDAVLLMNEMSENYRVLSELFPDNTKEGFDTEALPIIWEEKDKFTKLMLKASDDMTQLASIIEDADDVGGVLTKLMWSNCKACHNSEEYISQEVYVQIAIIKGKEKISTESAIDRYFNTNHFRDFSEGKPYFHFIDGLRDKCLGKLKNSPMRDKETEDETIKLLQKKLKNLTDDELEDTYWEIETGEFFSGEQIKELEKNCSELIKELNLLNKNKKEVQKTIMSFCENYEKLCQKKYPEAPLPLEILKSVN